jgi:hypothetical protein
MMKKNYSKYTITERYTSEPVASFISSEFHTLKQFKEKYDSSSKASTGPLIKKIL